MHPLSPCNPILSSSPSISKFISNHPSLLMLETQCSTMKDLHQLHSQIIKTGLAKDPIAISRLLSFTATNSSFADRNYAFHLFNHTPNPTLFMWNTLIRLFSDTANPITAISIFQQLLLSPPPFPNHLTFPSLFKSYANLGLPNEGSQLHAMTIKLGIDSDQYVRNSILAMYACCGRLAAATILFHDCTSFDVVAWNAMILGFARLGMTDTSRRLFDEMPARTVVTWSSMISGYVRSGRSKEGFDLFHQMQREKVRPNAHIMVSLLGACSSLGALEQGKWIHSFIKKNEISNNSIVITAIIDMYCKCGCVDEAIETFENSLVKSLSSWNSLIIGLATNGRGKEAIQLFTKLQFCSGFRPDNVSFICVLTACSHAGMIEEAFNYFKLMKRVYGIEPGKEHYGCLVDALGRAGMVEEAADLVRRMPVEPDEVIWGSLLSACRVHGKEFNWEIVVRKERGCSLIEMDGEVHEFLAHGVIHNRTGEIYQMLDWLLMNMRGDFLYSLL